MSKIAELTALRSKSDPEFADAYQQEDERLQVTASQSSSCLSVVVMRRVSLRRCGESTWTRSPSLLRLLASPCQR